MGEATARSSGFSVAGLRPISPLEWTADPPGVDASRGLGALRALVLTHFAVQGWAWWLVPLPHPATFPPTPLLLVALALTALSGISVFAFGRWAAAAGLPLAGWLVAWTLPFTPNHTFLALVLLGLFTLLEPRREDEQRLLVQTLRWLAAIVFVYAGLQKAFHGLYFRGEFLLWMIGQGVERWADVFGWMLGDAEVERLRSYPRFLVGAGPYRVDSALFVALANAVWVGETALGLGLLWRRTRAAAALAAIALVWTIQLAPREFMFALLYTQLLLVSVPGQWNRRLLPILLFAHWYLLAAMLGAPGSEWLLKATGNL